MRDPVAFRAQFPVFERFSYLNAGTNGPIPSAAVEAVRWRIEREAGEGRCGKPYFEGTMGMAAEARKGYAGVLGCSPEEVALTGSTTDGVNTVLSGIGLRHGDEILTSDEEHPGLLAPLGRARRVHGAQIRVVPFDAVADEVRSSTRLVACSHVSWVSGRIANVEALRSHGVPVLLDAAQALGAIPVDVVQLGVDFYACSGQKWLCGPEGSGCLFVRRELIADLSIPWPGYGSLADADRALELEPAEGASRFDHGFPSGLRNGWALASLGVLADAGWGWIHERAASLAARVAEALRERGLEVMPRDRSTLVSWRPPAGRDPVQEVERLAGNGIIVRSVTAFGGLLRASVGAWSDEAELEQLVELAAH
jgi:L-cysteine/cystine lyase